MISFFLNAKHWLIFLMQFLVPIIGQVIFSPLFVSSRGRLDQTAFGIYFAVLMFLVLGVLIGWFWSVVVGLNDKIPEELRLNIKRFKFFMIVPLIYMPLFGFFFMQMTTPQGLLNIAQYMPLIMIFHLFNTFCLFYGINAAAKTIKTVELKRKLTFSDFSGEFFTIWFFPIGIWFIQPRVNMLVTEESNPSLHDDILDL